MINAPRAFNGGTHFEVITVLANCGTDTDRARRALVTWIQRKQDKGRSTQHILTKLRDLELKFIKDTSLHPAFRAARAETALPRSPDLPLPDFVKLDSEAAMRRLNRPSMLDLTSTVTMSGQTSSSPGSSPSVTMYSPQSPSSSRGSEGKWEAESLTTRYSHLSTPPSPLQPRQSIGSYTSQPRSPTASTISRSPRRQSALEYHPPPVTQSQNAQRSRSQSQLLTGGRRITPSNRLSAPGEPLPPLPSGAQSQQVSPILSPTPAPISPATSPASPAFPLTPNSNHGTFVQLPPVLASESPDLAVTERQFIPGHLRLSSKATFSGERLVTREDSPVQGSYSGQEPDHTVHYSSSPGDRNPARQGPQNLWDIPRGSSRGY